MNWFKTEVSGPRRKALKTLTMASVLALGLSSLAPAAHAAGTTIRAVMHSGLRVLDPIITTAHITRNHGYMIYDTLLSMDANYKPQPQMAEYKVSDDGLTYTLTLRDGLLWHDGTPVTAEDCVASLKRWAQRDTGGQMLMDYAESLTAADAKTIVLKLKKPFGPTLEMLAKPSSVVPFMMPKRIAETPASESITDQIGSGPFKFVKAEFQPGVKVVYEKFDKYVPRKEPPSWTAGGKVAYVDRVEWVNMPDAQTALNAINNGEIDYMEAPPVDLLPLAEANPDIKKFRWTPLNTQTMGQMNVLYPPFDNVKIRRAAMLALGQNDVLAALIGNPEYFAACPSMYGCGVPLSTDAGAPKTFATGDIKAAQALLKEAGYDGTPVVILQPTDVITVAPQPVVAAQALRNAGFKVTLQPMDWQTLVTRRASQAPLAEGGWSLFFTNWIGAEVWTPLVNPMLNTRGKKGGFFGWLDDPEIIKMRDEFAGAKTLDEQKALAAKIQQRAYDDAAYVPLGSYYIPALYRTSLSGLIQGPAPLFWNIKKAN
ncbi:peptide/nickel transport system substrate-binding protein [Azorhizobium sp. AG788]|uniref:ABC transporter substrate-binding protein n=1 Tax=Azorhizobium sp. AG788 TaxID=2183897 RepID=UPI00105BB8FE|nr:ABC transporter substrate-binding protein [Azorhizobium sp. AG788]TDT99283.1 peptide/nickel transport system substrate-binding protein [Azorhizobium sp. AG788]